MNIQINPRVDDLIELATLCIIRLLLAQKLYI